MDRINIVQRKGVRESCSVMEGRDVRNESIFVLDDPFHVRNYLSGFCHFSDGFGLALWFCCLLEFLPYPGCCSLPAACGEVLGLDLSSNLRNHCRLCVSCGVFLHTLAPVSSSLVDCFDAVSSELIVSHLYSVRWRLGSKPPVCFLTFVSLPVLIVFPT
jgi:hypothetical protein